MISEATDAQFSAVLLIALVAACAVGLAWWQRTRGTRTGGDSIQLLAVRAMGGKRLLALVEVEHERFLLGLTDDRISCLARVDHRDRASDGPPGDVQTWLEQSA
ncbi:MAG: FliO/MopB family protein [Deltaproteobacteria bacterium]|nr:FliO/MopB family protein [Deltaproteobacteria bacterium]